MCSGVGGVAKVLADHVQNDGDDGSNGNRAPELKFEAGGQHGAFRFIDELTERHIRHGKTNVGKEYLIRNIGGNFGCGKCHDNGHHEGKNVLHGNAEGGRAEAFGCQVVFSVTNDDDLCTDEVRNAEPARQRQGEYHRPEACGENHNDNGDKEDIGDVADDVVDLLHDHIHTLGEAPDRADDNADGHIDERTDECKRKGDAGACPKGVKGGLTDTAGTEDPMDVVTVFFHGLRGAQMLAALDENVHIFVVARENGIDVCEQDECCQEAKDDDVGFFAEEYAEHRTPIGIAGCDDLFRVSGVVIHVGKQLAFGKTEILKIGKFSCHGLPRFRAERNSRIGHVHENIAENDGNDGNECIEEGQTDDNGVIIGVDGGGKQVTCTGDEIYAFGDDRADQRAQDAAGDAVDNRDGRILQDVLCEDLTLGKTAGTGELDVVGVHLVDHVAAEPLHEAGDGGKGERYNGQNIHQGALTVHREGGGESRLGADGLEHEDIGKGRNGDDEDDVKGAQLVDELILLAGHQNTYGHAYEVSEGGGDDTDDKGVTHLGFVVFHGIGVDVIIREAVGIEGSGVLGACGSVGRGVQVVGAVLGKTGGICDHRFDIRALGLGHGLEHVNVLVDGEGETEADGDEILMDIGELIVEIQQVFMLCTVAHDRGGEIFRQKISGAGFGIVDGVVQGECQTSVLYVVFNVMDVIDGDQIAEEGEHSRDERHVLGGEKLLLTAGGELGSVEHDRVKTCDRIAHGFILGCEFFDIFLSDLGIAACISCNFNGGGTSFLVDFATLGEGIQVIRKGYIVQVSELFPLLIFIDLTVIVDSLCVERVLREDQITLHQRVHEEHDDGNDNDN